MLVTASLTAALFLSIAPPQISTTLPAHRAIASVSEASTLPATPRIELAQLEHAVPPPAVVQPEPEDQNVEQTPENDQTDQPEQPETAQENTDQNDQQNAANDGGPVMPPQAPAEPPAETEMPPMPVYPPAVMNP